MMKKVLNLMMGVAVAVLGASVARAEAVPSVVAKIGEVRYETLSAAIHDAEPGATVQLQTDVVETVTADESAYVIVDLCGHTISNSTVAVDLTQTAGACLVLFNGTVRGALKVGSGNVGKEGNVLILGDGLTAQRRLSLRGGSMAVFATGSTGAYSGLYDVNRQEGGFLLAFPGARFAVDQTPVLGNPDDVRLKASGDGMYVAEAISEEPSAEPARVASPAHTLAAASAEEKWEPSLADWMATVTDGTMLGELCMPASHDAGMIYSRSIPGAFFVSKRAFCTQDLTVGKQLENGARYFDFRPYANPLIDVLWWKLVSILFQSYEIKARHFEWRGPGVKMGGIGDTFKNMFDEIRDFLDRHPGEIVMVNLSHWQTEGAKDGDLNKRLVMEFLKQEKYSKYFYCHQGPLVAGGLNCVTIGDVRKSGRRLIILLSDYGDAVDPANGYWGVNDFDNHFDRLNGATPSNNAFNVVGTYSDMNSAKAMEEKQLNYWKSWHENCTNKMDFAYKLAWEVTLSTRQSILTSVENIRHFAGDDGLSIEDWATRAKDLLKADLDIHVPIWGRPTMVNLDFVDSNACRAVVDINEELTLPKVTLVLSDDVNRAVQRLFDNALEKWQLLSNGVLTDLAPPSGTGTKEISLGRCKPGPVSLVFSGWFYDYTGRAFPVVRTVKLAEVVRSSPDMTVELAKASLPTEYNNGILPDFHEWNESTGALVVRQLAVSDAQQKKIRDIADAGAFLDAGNFYFVFTNTVCRERLTVRGKGKTHLILCDGATLTAEGGITVEPAGAELNICCQGAGTGALVATGRAGDAGIGGLRGQPGGSVLIHGGVVRAAGSVSEMNVHGSGIGGSGAHSKGGTLTVYGGEVIAAGGEGAGYGFGNGGDPLNVSTLATSDSSLVWRGGTVTLSCGDRTNSLHRVLTALGAKLSIGPNARAVCWGGATPAALLPLTTDAEIAAAKYLKIEKGAVLTLPRKVPGLTCQLVRYGHVLAGTEVGDRVFYRLNPSDHVRLDFKADEGYRLDGPCYETYQLEDGDVHLWEANFPSRAVRLCTLTLPVDTGALTYSVSPTGSVAAVTNGSCAVWTFDEGTSVSVTFAAKSGVSIDGSSELSYPDIAADQVVGLGDLPKVSCDYADESGGTASVAARVMPVTLAELADGETYLAFGETVLTNRLRVTGTARLVLADGAELMVKKGIEVASGRMLDICGQAGGTGRLICQGAQECAGIGGGRGSSGGTVNVFGGEIRTVGGGYAAGLGGGSGGSGGTVLISGGSVQAGGGYGGAGIGGGCAFAGDTLDGGSLAVSGGEVSAGGGYAAAGIGGGLGGHGARVEIDGGHVAATGSRFAAGVGGGAGGNGNDVVIRRGTLVATAGTGAQSIGTGEDGVSSGGLEHFGLGVFAGDDSRSATWFDDADVARKNPFVALLQVVSVTLTAEACDKIADVGPNIAVKLKSAGVEIPIELQGRSYVGYAAVGTDLQLLLVPPQGYGFGSHDGAIPLGTVGESDISVTLQDVSLPTLARLSPVSYWVIEGETAVERTRNSYVEVSAATASLEDGQWYVVTGEVTIDRRLPVHGHAHLILCDGAVLTVNGGIEVNRQNDVSDALDIHGSANGTGRLVAIATGERTAGIGGSHEAVVAQGLSGGVVTVCRAEVVAVGGRNGGAGIGGAWGGDGGEVYVCDAVVTATGGDYQGRDGERLHGAGIGAGARDFAGEGDSGWLWILGGETVVWSGESAETAKADVFCTMRNKYCRIEPGKAVSLPATFEAMTYEVSADGSAPLAGRTVDGRTYFMLPRACAALTVTFAAKPGCEIWRGDSTVTLTDFSATVSEFPADRLPSAAEPVPYVVRNGATTNDLTRLDYVPVTSATTGLTNGQWGVVRGEVTLEERLHITGSATILLADDAKLMAPAGIEVNERDALTIYGQAEGTGALEARGRYGEAGIGGGYENRSSGTVTVHGGVIMAVGGSNGAGIGGGWHYQGGTVLVYGGVVTATGGELSAGIGGSERNDGGTVTISGGTVVATGNRGEDIGGGAWGTYGDSVLTISGGSVKAKLRDGLAKNPANDRLSCVTVKCEGLDGLVNLGGLEGYGTNDIFAIDGCVYLWLPDGTHSFALSNGAKTLHYFAAVNGRDITVEPHPEIGFFVNGEEIVNGKGLGWTYDGQCLRFEAEDFYVLSGCSTNNEVRIVVEQPSVTLSLLNAVVLAKDHSALELKSGADVTLLMAGGTSILAATNGASAVTVEADAKLTVGLAPEADRLESALCVFNSCVEVPAVCGAGEAVVAGGTFLAWGDGQAVGLPTFNVGEDEVMKVGEDPDTARFAVTCGNASCVLVAPAVTVTVRDDIPHVSGFMVSNAVEAVAGQSVSGGTAYRVMLSDDVSVGYMLEASFVSDAENPFTYASIEHDVTIDASMIAVGVLVAPGVPVVFNSAAEASNAVARAELTPSAEVAAVFSEDADAKSAYCAKFGIGVVPTADGKWAVEAVLLPEPWTNVVESAQMATRQIPVAEIATLGPGEVTNVTVEGCVPGFYYTIYGGSTVTNLKAFVSETSRNVICKPGKPVTFSEVVKLSATAGFFTIGVKEAPGVTPSDKISPKSEPPAAIEIQED